MGVRGLNAFISSAPGCSEAHEFEEILKEIRSLIKPKIVIFPSALFNYFYSRYLNVVTGGRWNLIHKEFEEFLGKLKEAGAELVIACDDENSEVDFKWIQAENSNYEHGMNFLNDVQTKFGKSQFRFQVMNSTLYDNSMSSLLFVSASKYGELRRINGASTRNASTQVAKIAKEIGAYAVIGLDTGLLYVEGDFKLWFPKAHKQSEHSSFKFCIMEYKKKEILKFLDLDLSQFQFLAVLGGKFIGNFEAHEHILSVFPSKNRIEAIREFVHGHVPSPVTDATIRIVIQIIFGFFDLQIFKDFKTLLRILSLKFDDAEDKASKLFKDDPFSLGQFILGNKKISVSSYHLDVAATDMKPLKVLTLDWIKKTVGLLLQHVDGNNRRKIVYRVDETEWKTTKVKPFEPKFFVPDLEQLVSGMMDDEMKYKILAFLTGNIMGFDNLKSIPVEFLTHVIVTVHLVKNKSLQFFEAIAFTKVLKDVIDDKVPRAVVPLREVDVRALRTSFLYSTMFYHVTRCMSSVGLKSFISPILMDNAYYQHIYQETKEQKFPKEKIINQIMKIIEK